MIKTTSPKSRVPLYALMLGLLFSGWTLISCLPASYSLQVNGLKNCDGNTISNGTLDISIRATYQLKVALANWLAVAANPNTFVPETNYIEVNQVKVFFTYPKTFGVPPTDALYPTADKARVLDTYLRIEPSIAAGFDPALAQGGQGGAVTVNTVDMGVNIVTPETSRLWASAPELKTTASSTIAPSFTVVANVQFFGTTGTGAQLDTPVLKFPITVCNKCLDNEKGGNPNCASGTSSTECVGQDNFCKEATASQNP